MLQINHIDIIRKMGNRPLALYGLAGNPPHRGHWACVRKLADQGYFVLVAPSFAHAFGKRMAPFELRARWLREAGEEFGALGAHAEVWEEEGAVAREIPEGQPIYSIDMLERAEKIFSRAPRLAVGPDNLDPEVFKRFHESARIAAEFGLAPLVEAENTRSTQIREALASGCGEEFLRERVGRRIAPSVAKFFAKK